MGQFEELELEGFEEDTSWLDDLGDFAQEEPLPSNEWVRVLQSACPKEKQKVRDLVTLFNLGLKAL